MRLKSWLAPGLVAAACVAVFSPAAGHAFLDWDDLANFTLNPFWARPGWPSISWAFTRFHSGHYHPLTWLSLFADRALWGPGPRAVHTVNILLHAASAAVLCACARELFRARARGAAVDAAAAAAALLWAVHPLRVESVAWASERRDVLGGFLLLCAAFAYLRGHRAASMAAYAASLSAKAMGITFPALLLVLDLSRGRFGDWRAQARDKAWYAALAAIAAAVAFLAESPNGAAASLAEHPLGARLGACAYSTAFLLRKTLWPSGLLPLYPWPLRPQEWTGVFIASAAVVAALSALAWRLRRRAPAFGAAWLWYLAALAPVAGIVRFGPQLTADRFSYLPGLSLAMLAASPLLFLSRRRLLAGSALAAILCLGLAKLSRVQTLAWRDTETLWRRAVATQPCLWAAQLHLGNALWARGERAQALARYRAAVACEPEYAAGYNNLGNALSALGRQRDALTQLRRAERLQPGHAAVHFNIGRALEIDGRVEEARREYERELEIVPGFPPALEALERVANAGNP